MTRHHYQIIPECYADTLLVEMLGFARPNHQLGIGKVVGLFEKGLKNRAAVGIIDDDKVKPKDLDSFKIAAESHNIKRLTKGKHSILVICPAFEDWVFENAAAVGIDPTEYGFHSRKQFRKICKMQGVASNQGLKQLFNTLKQKQAPGFRYLKTWICESAGIDENDLD